MACSNFAPSREDCRRRAYRVGQDARDRHRPDPARHRRDGAGDRRRLRIGDVADEAMLAALPAHAVDADVDYRRARLDPIAPDHFRLADGGKQKIGAAADIGQIFRF